MDLSRFYSNYTLTKWGIKKASCEAYSLRSILSYPFVLPLLVNFVVTP